MSQMEDQLDSGGGITDFALDSLEGSVIRDHLDQRWCNLHKFS